MLWNGQFVLVHLTLCFALLGPGCGGSLKVPTKTDGGMAGDLDSGQAVGEDSRATPDAYPDAMSLSDGNLSDGMQPQDTNRPDEPLAPDGARADLAPTAQDGGKADAGVGPEDTSPSADALAETSALITFRFSNTRSQTVYLRRGCSYSLEVISEADGKTYSNQSFCACDCSSASCQSTPSCGVCAPTAGIPVEVGKSLDISWSALISTLQTKTGSLGTFQCVVQTSIPVGTYRIRITVYPTPEDAVALTNGGTVEMSFLLTTANATVEVPIQ
jgi:hypothetical protein